jgi:hypothetical protein
MDHCDHLLVRQYFPAALWSLDAGCDSVALEPDLASADSSLYTAVEDSKHGRGPVVAAKAGRSG